MKTIYLDINLGASNPINLTQFDYKSEKVTINLLKDRFEYDLTGKTVRLQGIKADKKALLLPTVIKDKNVIEFEITEQLTVVSGIVKLQLLIFGENGSLKNSKIFVICIDESLNIGEIIASDNDFKEIKDTLIKVEEWDRYFLETSGKLEEKYTTRLNGISSDLADIATYKIDKTISILRFERYVVAEDWIPAINKAFDFLADNFSGGIIKFPSNKLYPIKSSIVMRENMYIEGIGGDCVILKNSINDFPMITIDDVSKCGLSNITINGNKMGENSFGVKIFATDGNRIVNKIDLNNVAIGDINGTGLFVGGGYYVLKISDINIYTCTKIGFRNEGTDNNFNNFIITQCKTGMYLSNSGNNKFSNFKIDFAGKYVTDGDYSNSCGVYSIDSKRDLFTNIECQECLGHGFIFENCHDLMFSNLLSDSNGRAVIDDSTIIAKFGVGFKFKNCSNISGILKATDFRNTKTQYKGLYVENCRNFNFDYTESDQYTRCTINKSIGISLNNSLSIDLCGSLKLNNLVPSGNYNDTTTYQFSDGASLVSVINNTANIKFTNGKSNDYVRIKKGNIDIQLIGGRSYLIGMTVKNITVESTLGYIECSGVRGGSTFTQKGDSMDYYSLFNVPTTGYLALTIGKDPSITYVDPPIIDLSNIYIIDVTDVNINSDLPSIISELGMFYGLKNIGIRTI